VEKSGTKWWKSGRRKNQLLIGEYEHSLDAKGRLIMPAKLRADIGETFIVTKGLDGCLFAFSQNEWLNFETKLKALPLSDKNARNFVRFFLSGATECEIDKQGRFLIPTNLREAANLTKETVIIGVGTRLEIWDKEKWAQCDEEISADEIAENMTMLGI
jgi:MraZ protein